MLVIYVSDYPAQFISHPPCKIGSLPQLLRTHNTNHSNITNASVHDTANTQYFFKQVLTQTNIRKPTIIYVGLNYS